MEFDINKMPLGTNTIPIHPPSPKLGLTTILNKLGKLKKSHVQKGYEVLKKIEKVLGTVPVNRNKLNELASSFYSLIPHDFGMSRPPPIDTSKKIKKKLAMLEVCCVSLKKSLYGSDAINTA